MNKTSWMLIASSGLALAYAVAVTHPPVATPSDSIACGDEDAKKKKKGEDEDKS